MNEYPSNDVMLVVSERKILICTMFILLSYGLKLMSPFVIFLHTPNFCPRRLPSAPAVWVGYYEKEEGEGEMIQVGRHVFFTPTVNVTVEVCALEIGVPGAVDYGFLLTFRGFLSLSKW